jgi:hypothetical protein
MAVQKSKKHRLTKADAEVMMRAGTHFLGTIFCLMQEAKFQEAADNLANLLTWSPDAKPFNEALKTASGGKKLQPLQLLSMGILLGKRGGKFPFTAKENIS